MAWTEHIQSLFRRGKKSSNRMGGAGSRSLLPIEQGGSYKVREEFEDDDMWTGSHRKKGYEQL